MTEVISIDLFSLHNDALPVVRSALDLRGFEFVAIDLGTVASTADCFFQIIEKLPCDPPYQHKELNDAAVADSLFGGIHHQENLAVLLLHAELLVSRHVNVLFYFHEVISYNVTVKRAAKNGKTQRVKIFAFGEGDNFASLSTSGPVAMIEM